jgi:NADH-quinone oxidoreductase subunit J
MPALISSLGMPLFLAQAGGPVLPAIAIVALCAVAGIGTMMLLPSHYHPSWRKVGGALTAATGLIFLAAVLRHEAAEHQADIHSIYFYIFSAFAIVCAVRVVTHRQPVYSALYFVLTVFASAGLFVLLMADFMAAALVIIYAGAILITYVFVIMLASQPTSVEGAHLTPAQQMADYDNVSRDPFIAPTIGFALMGILLFVIFDRAEEITNASLSPTALSVGIARQAPAVEGNTQELGVYLFSHQQVSLELAGLLLTIAMVGAIVIARRRVTIPESLAAAPVEMVVFPATPVDDNPHSIPVYGTDNPSQKAYPET